MQPSSSGFFVMRKMRLVFRCPVCSSGRDVRLLLRNFPVATEVKLVWQKGLGRGKGFENHFQRVDPTPQVLKVWLLPHLERLISRLELALGVLKALYERLTRSLNSPTVPCASVKVALLPAFHLPIAVETLKSTSLSVPLTSKTRLPWRSLRVPARMSD